MKKFRGVAAGICALAALAAGCTSYTKNDIGYWFDRYEKTFVSYDGTVNDRKGNLDNAGTYWEMTVKTDCTVDIYIGTSGNTTAFDTAFYLNGTPIGDESEEEGFFCSGLALKEGDELCLHAFWTDPEATDGAGFTVSSFVIADETGRYEISFIS